MIQWGKKIACVKGMGAVKGRGKILLFILLAVAVGFGIFVFWQNRENQTVLDLTAQQKTAEVETLWQILTESYPFWEEATQAGISQEDFLAPWLEKAAATKTDIEYFKCLDAMVGEFGGLGHLGILDGQTYRLYREALSAGDGILTQEEEEKLAPLVQALNAPATQQVYALLDQSHSGFRSRKGLKEEYLQVQESETSQGERPALTTYPESQAACLRISSFPLDHYWEDSAILDYLYRQAKDYPNLILDIRGNGGGSDRYWQDLIVTPNAKEPAQSQRYFLFQDSGLVRAYREANGIPAQPLTSESPAPLNRYLGQFSHYTADVTACEIASHPYPGKIWVLVDEGVYSAAENFVAFCKNTGFATLVGEATGGDGGIADPILVSLPESGLLLRFSVFYGINADGTGNEAAGTQPDLSVPQGEDALAFLLDQLAEETDAASVPLQGQGQ